MTNITPAAFAPRIFVSAKKLRTHERNRATTMAMSHMVRRVMYITRNGKETRQKVFPTRLQNGLENFGFIKCRTRVIEGIPTLAKSRRKGGASNTSTAPTVTAHTFNVHRIGTKLTNVVKGINCMLRINELCCVSALNAR